MSSVATLGRIATEPRSTVPQRSSRVKEVVGLVARVVLGAVLAAAGYLKVIDPVGSTQSVVAYDIFPYEVARFIGLTVPVIEIAVGVLLIVGLFSRVVGARHRLRLFRHRWPHRSEQHRIPPRDHPRHGASSRWPLDRAPAAYPVFFGRRVERVRAR